ncbi:hypothetical protein IVA80_15145 [Bradyrhizobium sp. 139]|uniref:hypothetical protein n=1 Tax=Bradyrhizobium sp. 139 TaxID=2782616 RepID=UPI001FF8555F|nr:hypothetical protein [Bradyrhizobium sp. 139]MCK1742159.1 hypothetical protein [Bradyrhizobium sp. 139]
MDKWIIVTGPLLALELVGPFETKSEAIEYARKNDNEDVHPTMWDVVPLAPPEPYHPYKMEPA